MSITNRKKALNAEIAQLQNRLERLVDEAIKLDELVERLPDLDQYPEGAVIYWEHVFSTSTRVYTYCAIKCSGAWYTSGPKAPGPYTGEHLAVFIADGNPGNCYWEIDSMTRVEL